MSANFNRIAWVYDFLARLVFFGSIRRSQRSFLNVINSNHKILVIGGGTGYILKDIMCYGTPDITYIDSSSKMISKAKKRGYPEDKIEFKSEFYTGNADEQYDIIITAFFLDMFQGERLMQLMAEISLSLKDNGKWLFSEFNEDIVSMSFAKRSLLKLMFWFFRKTCGIQSKSLGAFRNNFISLGFKPKSTKLFYAKMIQSIEYNKNT